MANRAWDKRGKGHDGPWDTIVIGSGMGGMTTAALLSEVGQRVLVLEQHYEPGGFTHTFRRPGGYEWDVGVHAIGEVTEHSVTGRILARLTREQLEWASLGPTYEHFHFPDGFEIEFPDTPHKFRDNLVAAFPDRVEDIDRYLDRVRDVAGQMQRYYMSRALPPSIAPFTDKLLASKAKSYFGKTVEEVMDEVTDDPRLRAVLCSQWGYYGAIPSDASFAIQALVTKHFLWGAYYPVGGSRRIAEELLGRVADNGGWTRIATPVDEILIDGSGRANGVRTGDEVILADRIVSAVGAHATVQRLLPKEHRRAEWADSFEALEPASAHVCLYIGFKGDIRQAGASGANQWFNATWDQSIESWRVDPDVAPEEWPDAPILYCSFPSLKDPAHNPGPEIKHTGEVVTFVPWEVFEPWTGTQWKRRPEEYDRFKKDLEEHLMAQYVAAMPELEPMIDYVEFSTPLTTHHFDRAIGGSIYGLEPTVARYENRWLRPKSPISGLYLSGCDVGSPGVIGAMFGGVLAALAAQPLAIGNYLRDLM